MAGAWNFHENSQGQSSESFQVGGQLEIRGDQRPGTAGPSPHPLPYASACSWVAFFLITWFSREFPESCEPLQHVNQTRGGGCGNLQSIVVFRSTGDNMDLRLASGVGGGEWADWHSALTSGIWCYFQADTVKTELNCRVPSWCPRIAWCREVHTHLFGVQGMLWVVRAQKNRRGVSAL